MLQGLIDHLTSAFQSGKTDNSLIAEEIYEAFTDQLQILVCELIDHKPPFSLEVI